MVCAQSPPPPPPPSCALQVGVVGIGGLGHMGLQYAAAMGAQTWAISTSAAKEAEARKFGAQHFLVSKDAAAMKAQEKSFDFILCSATGDFPLGPYLKLLKPRTKFALVGLPAVSQPLKFEPFDIVSGEKEIIGSMIGGTAAMTDMLNFSAQHKCFPQCEIIDFADVSGREGRRRGSISGCRYDVADVNMLTITGNNSLVYPSCFFRH